MNDGKLTDEQRTGGRDSQLSHHAEEGGALVGMESTKQTDKVLAELRRARFAADVEEGFFREYPDWRPRDEQGRPRSWRDLQFFAQLPVDQFAAQKEEQKLRAQLVKVAEVTVAWIEALDRRQDERRMAVVRLGWWARLRFRLTGRLP